MLSWQTTIQARLPRHAVYPGSPALKCRMVKRYYRESPDSIPIPITRTDLQLTEVGGTDWNASAHWWFQAQLRELQDIVLVVVPISQSGDDSMDVSSGFFHLIRCLRAPQLVGFNFIVMILLLSYQHADELKTIIFVVDKHPSPEFATYMVRINDCHHLNDAP